jgi:hypothetical protein
VHKVACSKLGYVAEPSVVEGEADRANAVHARATVRLGGDCEATNRLPLERAEVGVSVELDDDALHVAIGE